MLVLGQKDPGFPAVLFFLAVTMVASFVGGGCSVCLHSEAAAIRLGLGRGAGLGAMAPSCGVPVWDLWRCRVHHVEDPVAHYDGIWAAAARSRFLNGSAADPISLRQALDATEIS